MKAEPCDVRLQCRLKLHDYWPGFLVAIRGKQPVADTPNIIIDTTHYS